MSLITQAAVFAAGAAGDTPVNDAALSRLIMVTFGLAIMVVGLIALFLGRKGQVNKPLNALWVVLICSVIVTIGASFMFPDLGETILSTLFSI